MERPTKVGKWHNLTYEVSRSISFHLDVNFASNPPSPPEFPGPLTPTPLECPIPSVVGVWIFSGTTHFKNKLLVSKKMHIDNNLPPSVPKNLLFKTKLLFKFQKVKKTFSLRRKNHLTQQHKHPYYKILLGFN